jgi:hypothetical protein
MPTRHVERMAKRGQIPSITLPNGDIVFDQAELLMWLDHLRDEPRQQRSAPAPSGQEAAIHE